MEINNKGGADMPKDGAKNNGAATKAGTSTKETHSGWQQAKEREIEERGTKETERTRHTRGRPKKKGKGAGYGTMPSKGKSKGKGISGDGKTQATKEMQTGKEKETTKGRKGLQQTTCDHVLWCM